VSTSAWAGQPCLAAACFQQFCTLRVMFYSALCVLSSVAVSVSCSGTLTLMKIALKTMQVVSRIFDSWTVQEKIGSLRTGRFERRIGHTRQIVEARASTVPFRLLWVSTLAWDVHNVQRG
jgi:hypothetical protein